MSAGSEIAAGADEPASVFIGVMGSETDRNGTLVTLGALQPVEDAASHLREEASVALDGHKAFRSKFDCLHDLRRRTRVSEDWRMIARSQQYKS